MKMRKALWQLITYRPGLYTANVFAWIAILLKMMSSTIHLI